MYFLKPFDCLLFHTENVIFSSILKPRDVYCMFYVVASTLHLSFLLSVFLNMFYVVARTLHILPVVCFI
jgi:hypothetical protein